MTTKYKRRGPSSPKIYPDVLLQTQSNFTMINEHINVLFLPLK